MKQAMGFRFLGLQICRRMKINMIKLGDVATYINGYAFKPEDRGVVGLPIIRIQDLTGSAYDLGFYDGDYPKRIEINDGDVLISWSASLGVYVWNGGRALLNQHIFKVQFDKADIDKRYFVYAVRQKLAELTMKTHGATMKHIVKKDFEETSIPYPSQKKQIEIGINLDKIANIIAARKQQLELLDELVKARFVEMFGNPVLNDKRWEQKSLGDITTKIGSGATPKGGKETYQEKGITLIRSMNVHNGKFEYKDLAHISDEQGAKLDNVMIEENDVLLNITGASVARSCVVPNNILPARVNQHVCIIRCKKCIIPEFLNNLLIDDNYQELLWNIAGSGATREAITKQQVENLNIILPSIELQNEFIVFCKQIDKSKVAVQKALDETQMLFDSLMQEYFG